METDVLVPCSGNEDWDLAQKLKYEDPGQFQTLVRMHLSFVLDLNTDDCDSQPEKSKLKSLKWSFAHFSKKIKAPGKSIEGSQLTKDGICQVNKLIEFLSKEENVVQEGIFRRTGKLTRQQELKSQLVSGAAVDLAEGSYSVHDCASVLKTFLAELPEPLLTEASFPAYCQIAELSCHKPGDERLQQALQLLLLLLPADSWALLRDLLRLLHLVASHQCSNKMTADNLATLFTPHLLCPRKLPPEALHATSQSLSRVLAFMVTAGPQLFRIPTALATDIRMYWERRRRQSPHNCLNESSAATTVFSFVDRERTAQENIVNPTEAALAQLYAHIQSLPESSKKRRLVKQFNKENGHGTPSNARTRSIGDSIKKHIFNKTLKPARGFCEFGQLKKRSSSEEILNETMMTPRSRKPVMAVSASNICHLANLTWGVKDDSWADSESLSGVFREYLSNRSLLTASPVDLSFSSRTGDFDPSTCDELSSHDDIQLPNSSLSESLLYVLDGNVPSDLSDSSGYGETRARKREAEAGDGQSRKTKRLVHEDSSGLGLEPPHETSL